MVEKAQQSSTLNGHFFVSFFDGLFWASLVFATGQADLNYRFGLS